MPRTFLFALGLAATLALSSAQTPRPGGDATFGTVVAPASVGGVNYLVGGASDIVLDEGRGRLYLVNTGQRRVEIYSIPQRRFLAVVQTDATPISAALSPSADALYVTCFDGSSLNIIDLNLATPAVIRRVSLPARPEGIAAGLADDGRERVLLTTIGTGTNNTANVLLVFDPSPDAATDPIQNVIVTPPPPPSPLLPPPSGRVAFAARTNLIATADRKTIIGFAAGGANDRTLFVYSVNSGSVLRSRRVNETSTVLSVAPGGDKFMAGLRLFDAETLQVIAQQSAANLPYTLPAGSNFNVQQNQGGSVFAPDGSYLFTAFNFAPLQNPASRVNVSQLLINDPDNMLTFLGLKMPENLSGNMVISSDGGTIYAISESGFMILPVARVRDNPIAMPESTSILLASDQCAVTKDISSVPVAVNNAGTGRFTLTPQLVPNVGPGAILPPVAGAGGSNITVVLPPGTTVDPTRPVVPLPGGGGGVNQQQQIMVQTSPLATTQQTGSGGTVIFTFNSVNARSLGTTVPHDIEIYAPEAVNIPPQIRVFQNMRNAEATGQILPVPVSPVGAEGLVDMVVDSARQRLFIANSGLNRVEVFDMQSRTFQAPIKVGQMPRSLALTPDGYTLYVANAGGESIFGIDTQSLQVVQKIKFPPLPFNSFAGIITPSVIAATERGLQIIMNNGTLWSVIDDDAMPRQGNSILSNAAIPGPRSMAATPNGEFLILLAGNGIVYLYDALTGDYVHSRQVFTNPIQGYYGPIAAGPRGQYFVVNGSVLNQALSTISTSGSAASGISAVTAAGATTYARFVPPLRANANTLPTAPPTLELVDPATGQFRGQFTALESPLATLVGTNRVNVDGRLMAVDGQAANAFVLTTSGLSIVPLQTPPAAARPAINANGVVNFASQTQPLPQGGIVSIYGRNLGSQANSGSGPLPPNMGGVCVTVNNSMLPLSLTSPGQINAQLPMDLVPGRYSIVVRNVDQKLASTPFNITVNKYAPAVLIDEATKLPAIYHDDGSLVTSDKPARRDDRLFLFALGLGPVKGPRLTAGQPTPATPAGHTDHVRVFFDNPLINESEMDVEDSIIMPGLVGVYRIQLYVPWYRRRGDKLLVTVRIGNVDSPSKGPAVPYIKVE
ncbi:MAG: hypothetical protein HY858_17200 [Candidatus Solibacter usitatus]|nr:hypothetical protein [Candidatus Solibacter usitatus]